jgi:hypothetical protein
MNMVYDEIVKECKTLSYRDKFSLSLLLIQMARKEEETQNPQNRATAKDHKPEKDPKSASEEIQYITYRLSKLRPIKKESLINAIKTMHQFKEGVSDKDVEAIIAILEKEKFLKIVNNRVVVYLKDGKDE